jgi:MFS family permease
MFGWSSIFLINIPIGLIAIILTLKYIPSGQLLNKEVRFDFLGSIYIFIGLLAFLFAINNGNDFGWNSVPIILSFILSILLFILFYFRENNISFPLLDLTFFKNINFNFAALAFMLIYLITNGMVFIFPFYLQWGRGLSINESGLLMVIPSVMQVISGSISGHLSDKIGCKKICITGIIMTIAAYILFYISGSFSGIYMIVVSVVLFGIAIGTFIPSNTNMIMAYAPEDKKGIISGIMITINRAGSALGVCLYGAVFSIFVPEKNLIKTLPVEILMKGFKYTFILGIIITVLALIFSSIAKDEKKIH